MSYDVLSLCYRGRDVPSENLRKHKKNSKSYAKLQEGLEVTLLRRINKYEAKQ